MNFVVFLKRNWLNLLLVIVGASALLVYLLQKKNEKRAAATKVLLQIDQIEKNVMALKSNREIDNLVVYKIPAILAHSSWAECGYQFYGSMEREDIKLIDDFFACAAELEKSRVAICQSLTTAWGDKDAELQARIADFAVKKENVDENIDAFIAAFNSKPQIFTAKLPTEILLTNINSFQTLSGTTAYKRLQRISYRR